MARPRLLAGVESHHVKTELARLSLARSRLYVRCAVARSAVALFYSARCRTAASSARTVRGTGSSLATTSADTSPRVGRLGGGARPGLSLSCATHPYPGTIGSGCVTYLPAASPWTTVRCQLRSHPDVLRGSS